MLPSFLVLPSSIILLQLSLLLLNVFHVPLLPVLLLLLLPFLLHASYEPFPFLT
ncbi:hypothetical protein BCV72DRAFT_14557 [Rhizopus microsporus var. microsporus]|uniref:Uncharacterized protein n=1 Tax=Rhizopus microsporus var. microsporus TaxID=86635 RepID=A0A1X0QXB7_RHIZD|nr:hypothetical protein BCV72DRAFT_14557 [Rhizopus microsporus var. microsporus]